MTAPGSTRPRPDASMTLLREVMERPLDPGYAAAARRRASGQDDVRGRGAQRALTVVLAAAAGTLLVTAVADLRLPGHVDSRSALSEEVVQRTQEVEEVEALVAALQEEVDGIGRAALSESGGGVVERAQLLARTAGAAPVVGPGVRVVLDDAESLDEVAGAAPRDLQAAEQGRVRDLDIQVVVNGLWDAGAEAVAVNGQRLTSMSSIREAGPAILVNFRPLSPPYEVEAIGDPQELQVRFAPSAAGRYLTSLENYGVRTSMGRVDDLQLPGAAGVRLRHAEPLVRRSQDGATTTPAPAATPTSEDSS